MIIHHSNVPLCQEELEQELGKIIDNAIRFFPETYEKAKILLREGSVKEYIFENKENSVFLVVGRHSQYVISVSVINGRLHFFCSCPDFFFHTLLKSAEKRRPFCQHILAVVLKEKNRLEMGETKKSTLLEEEEYWLELLSDLIT